MTSDTENRYEPNTDTGNEHDRKQTAEKKSLNTDTTDEHDEFIHAFELMKHLEQFNGTGDPRTFLEEIEITGITMDIHSHKYPKLACTLLRGEAARWILETPELRNTSWERFKSAFTERFQIYSGNDSALIKFVELKQGTRDIVDYVKESRCLRRQIDLKIPEKDLIAMFLRGLRDQEILSISAFTSLDEAMTRAINVHRIHHQMNKQKYEYNRNSNNYYQHKRTSDQQIRWRPRTGPLNPHSREKCEREGLCFVCGAHGHITPNCPQRAERVVKQQNQVYHLTDSSRRNREPDQHEDFYPDSILLADEGMESPTAN